MSTSHHTSPTPSGVPARAGLREWASLVVLILAVALLAIDGTVLYLAVPSLIEDLAPTSTEILWIGDIYSFVIAGLLITMGNVADRFGRKKVLLIGSAAFGLASLLAAFAATPVMLIAARALLGVAGATIMPSTLSIIRQLFHDPVQRTTAIGIWSAGATGGAALGPLVGGLLLENFWWGSVFILNIPVMIAILIFGGWLLKESKNPNSAKIDLLSSALSILAIVPIVYAVKHSMSVAFDVQSIVTLVVGVTAGALFVARQRRLPVPMIDINLFKIPAFAGAVTVGIISLFGFMGALFFLSQYLQLVRGFSPFTAGLAELPSTIASIVAVALIGICIKKFGRGHSIALGLGVSAAGLALIGVFQPMTSFWGIGIALAVLGLGAGIASALSTDAVVSAAPVERAGAASSISETAYELGVALGIAVLGSVHTAIYRASLSIPDHISAADRAHLEESLASTVAHIRVPEVLDAAKQAFGAAVQDTAYIAAAVVVVGAAVAWRVIPSSPLKDSATHVEH